jgi:hypothetical protein
MRLGRLGKVAGRAAMAGALVGGVVAIGAGPAAAQATTVDCSAVFPELGGTIVFTPNGQLLGNCWEHHSSPGGGSTGGSAEIVACEDELGQPGWVGIAVHTPEGSTYINCHVHVT